MSYGVDVVLFFLKKLARSHGAERGSSVDDRIQSNNKTPRFSLTFFGVAVKTRYEERKRDGAEDKGGGAGIGGGGPGGESTRSGEMK